MNNKFLFKQVVQQKGGFLRGPFGGDLKKEIFVEKSKDTYKVYEQGVVLNSDKSIGRYYISDEDYPHRLSIKWNGKILKSSMPENFKSSIKANTFYELTPEYIIMIQTLIKSESFIKFNN